MQPNFKRIVITGIPGSDLDETSNVFYVDALKQRLESEEYRVKAQVFPVRDLIYGFAKQEHITLDQSKIHNFHSDKRIRLLRQLAFVELGRQLLERELTGSSYIALIRTRATSFSAHGKEEALHRRYLEAIKPDLLVVVIDDPAAIFNRIPKHEETKKYAELKIDELVLWLENEVADMQELAQDLDCPLYVMPRRQVGALAELIMTDKKPAYVSYAMTGAGESVKRQKDELVESLQKYFVVFDPECMGTAHSNTSMTNEEQGSYRNDVILRDEQWFIDINSKYVIVYLPEKTPAHGSQSELHTGSEECKTVLVVLEPSYSDERGRLTPFIDQRAELVCISSEEFKYYLDLSEREQKLYSYIVKSMWGFKRRGRLSGLKESHVNGRVPRMSEDELFREYAQECETVYKQQMIRGVLPALGDEAVLQMAKDCWAFNKPLWASRVPESNIFQLPLQEPTTEFAKRAARSDSLASMKAPIPQLTTPQTGLSDDEVFLGIFGRRALTKDGSMWLEKLKAFFIEDDLGPFEQNADFLRFLKRTLDSEKQSSPDLFSSDYLKAHFRDFNRQRT
jgi:adenylate kinase